MKYLEVFLCGFAAGCVTYRLAFGSIMAEITKLRGDVIKVLLKK